MAYCSNCGQFVADGVKFCSNCGSPVTEEDRSKRRHEWAGKVIKCPSCGTEIPSFTAICPGCGHEINSARVSSAIKEFTTQISQYDIAIANSPAEPKKGWSSWGKGKKFWWVVLNIYTLCIPLVIYLLLPVLGIGSMSSLTPEEKKKAQYINNFTFPNDRENILEGLLYIKSQMSALVSGKIDRNTSRWIKIWKNKASQLYERAEILFKGDKIANSAYTDILSCEKKVQRSLLSRAIVAAIIVLLFITFLYTRGGLGRSIKEANEKANATFIWPTAGIALQIPEPPSSKGEIDYNDDEKFWVDIRGVSEEDYLSYIDACKEDGFVIEAEKNSISYEAYNEEGYHLHISYYSSHSEMSIHLQAPEKMEEIQWPKSDIASRLPVPDSTYGRIEWEADYGFVIYLGKTPKQAFKDYADACYNLGFNIDYKRGETYFRASDKDGYHVSVEYRGNSIMWIRIDDPE